MRGLTGSLAARRASAVIGTGLLLAGTGLTTPLRAQEVDMPANPRRQVEAPEPLPDPSARTDVSSEIVVVGTLIRGLDVRLPIPVTVLSQEDLVARGHSSVADALARSSVATGAVSRASEGYTQGARTVSLFGFGPGFTKFLVDGRSAANYPALYNNQSTFVDIGAIPSALVETIEILPGGQSSLYGSDAIAGVVNIQLKRKLDGPVAEARLGLFDHGGGRSFRVAFADGFESGDFSLMAGVQYEDIRPLWAFQRQLTRANFNRGATPWEPDPVFALTRFDFSYVSPPDGACDAGLNLFDNSVGVHVMPDGGSYCANLNHIARTLDNAEKRLQGYTRASYNVGSSELYADLLVNRSTARYTSALIGQSYLSPFFRSTALEETIRFSRSFSPEEYGGLGNQLSSDRLTSVAAAGGARGTLSNSWSYDVAVQHTRQNLSMRRAALLNDPLTAYFEGILGAETGSFDDPFLGPVPVREPDLDAYFRTIPNATFDTFRESTRAHASTRSTWARALISNNDLFALPGGNAGIALGIEGLVEKWRYNPDPRVVDGIFFQQISDVSGGGSRKAIAAVSELQLPVVDFATLSGSLRYDRYFTRGVETGKASWNVAAELRPLRDFLLLRARYGTAFKAPTLSDLFQGDSSVIGSSDDFLRCAELGYPPNAINGCPYRSASFVQATSGNVSLKPMTANVLDIGGRLAPTDKIHIDFDYLRWRVDNQVTSEAADVILLREAQCAQPGADPVICAANAALITRLPNGTLDTVFTPRQNLARQWVEALTMGFNAAQDFGDYGDLTLDINWTYLLKRKSRQYPGAAVIDELSNASYYMGSRTKLNAWLGWHRKAVDLTIGFDRLGRTPNFLASIGATAEEGAGKLPSWTVWTLSGSIQVTKTMRLSLTINNLFDSAPPLDYSVYGFSNSPYSSSANVNGRQLLFQVNVGL